jgi:hypothetical protein
MRAIVASVALALTLVASAAQVDAAPITYEFSGIGSGAIGGQSFTDALVVYSGTADTDDVVTLTLMGATFYTVGLDNLTVTIDGIGTATVKDLTKIVSIPQALQTPELPPFPLVFLARIDDPSDVTDMDKGIFMAASFSDALAGYDLKTSFGPIDVGGVGFIEDCGPGEDELCIETSLGFLSFTHNLENREGGAFGATVEDVPVPEPATLLLMGGGLAAFVRRSRRGRRG